jgi:hypothetical protein
MGLERDSESKRLSRARATEWSDDETNLLYLLVSD